MLSLVACSSPTAAPFQVPSGATEWPGDSLYPRWFAEVKAESGIDRDTSRVRWFLVPEPWHSERYGQTIEGLWVPDGRIYIAAQWRGFENLVKHEMLHELLQGDLAHAHPLFDEYPLGFGCTDPIFCP